ncbi:hypothetical protein LSH36_427g04005, partial [Paralvinella palmiformis]
MSEIADQIFAQLFEEMGYPIEPEDVDVFNKLRELCIIHRCEPETICGEWVAYSKNRNITIKVTTEHLDQMERESQKRQITPEARHNKRLTNVSRSPVVPFSPSSFSPV